MRGCTIVWGKENAQSWLAILDKDVIGPTRKFSVTLADYVAFLKDKQCVSI
jgi:hypothetical protein